MYIDIISNSRDVCNFLSGLFLKLHELTLIGPNDNGAFTSGVDVNVVRALMGCSRHAFLFDFLLKTD